MPTILTKYHLFENSLAGVAESSNLGTRLNMVVYRKSDPFSTILFSKFSRRISFRIVLPVALHMSSTLTKIHVFQNSLAGVPRSPNLGTPPPMKSICPFLVYETFHKIFTTNFLKKIPASWSVYALYTHQVSSLSKLPSWGIRELELGNPSQYGLL